VFWEVFTPPDPDFGIFLDKLTACIRLLRGINAVIRAWWDVLVKTEIGTLMQKADDHHQLPKGSLGECAELKSLINEADLSSSSIETCHDALEKLQVYFDCENTIKSSASSTHQVFAWLVTASEEYTNLLDQRRPEALVLLAYFSVLLHRRNKSWIIGDAGIGLLTRLRQYLGKRWDRWLEWPESAMGMQRSMVAASG
jgi:hypothetical protein